MSTAARDCVMDEQILDWCVQKSTLSVLMHNWLDFLSSIDWDCSSHRPWCHLTVIWICFHVSREIVQWQVRPQIPWEKDIRNESIHFLTDPGKRMDCSKVRCVPSNRFSLAMHRNLWENCACESFFILTWISWSRDQVCLWFWHSDRNSCIRFQVSKSICFRCDENGGFAFASTYWSKLLTACGKDVHTRRRSWKKLSKKWNRRKSSKIIAASLSYKI